MSNFIYVRINSHIQSLQCSFLSSFLNKVLRTINHITILLLFICGCGVIITTAITKLSTIAIVSLLYLSGVCSLLETDWRFFEGLSVLAITVAICLRPPRGLLSCSWLRLVIIDVVIICRGVLLVILILNISALRLKYLSLIGIVSVLVGGVLRLGLRLRLGRIARLMIVGRCGLMMMVISRDSLGLVSMIILFLGKFLKFFIINHSYHFHELKII